MCGDCTRCFAVHEHNALSEEIRQKLRTTVYGRMPPRCWCAASPPVCSDPIVPRGFDALRTMDIRANDGDDCEDRRCFIIVVADSIRFRDDIGRISHTGTYYHHVLLLLLLNSSGTNNNPAPAVGARVAVCSTRWGHLFSSGTRSTKNTAHRWYTSRKYRCTIHVNVYSFLGRLKNHLMVSPDCRLQEHYEYAVQIRTRLQVNRHEKYVSNDFVQDTIVEYFRSIRDKGSKSWLINITVFHKTIFETSNVQV